MEAFMMTLTSGVVSGVRPYFMLFVLGLAGRLLEVQEIPQVMQRTDVLVIAAILVVVDFLADKVQFLDSVWDAINTVVRPVAGGAIGFLLGGETDTTTAVIYAAVGTAAALGTHGAKAATRAAVNISPEPVSNVLVSVIEDIGAALLAILAVLLPILAGIAAVFILIGAIVAIVVLVRFVRKWRARRDVQNGAVPEGTAPTLR
ncbi:DUF4126 domain-containing protein [Dermabacter sp. HSID17554]|uniref:DUF4126 domain-containing protein n=1 Tax=Dermabacter sp. HSID17554 TaxID=2419511 RepID=UPI000F88E68D|nr:DUF4126 domain-containing protein [Dermabacter sp. HSID17554]RUP85688.1 DUF4126 domain-containing protein [Dermabacter sp. HSID17554]